MPSRALVYRTSRLGPDPPFNRALRLGRTAAAAIAPEPTHTLSGNGEHRHPNRSDVVFAAPRVSHSCCPRAATRRRSAALLLGCLQAADLAGAERVALGCGVAGAVRSVNGEASLSPAASNARCRPSMARTNRYDESRMQSSPARGRPPAAARHRMTEGSGMLTRSRARQALGYSESMIRCRYAVYSSGVRTPSSRSRWSFARRCSIDSTPECCAPRACVPVLVSFVLLDLWQSRRRGSRLGSMGAA